MVGMVGGGVVAEWVVVWWWRCGEVVDVVMSD